MRLGGVLGGGMSPGGGIEWLFCIDEAVLTDLFGSCHLEDGSWRAAC